MPYIQKTTRSGFEIQADFPYKGNFFPTIEVGYLSVDDNNESFHYINKGPYGRIGVDVNINKFESLSDNDLVFVGARYGFTRFSQETPFASYSNYWGTLNTSFPVDYLNAHWAEVLFGLKGELLPNIFFGWSLRAKFLLAHTKDMNVKPYVIPGLGYTSSEVPFDFSVTVSYRFPIIKTKTLPKPLKSAPPKQSEDDDEEENMIQNNQNGYGSGTRNMNNQ
jgi:hypothetical protein